MVAIPLTVTRLRIEQDEPLIEGIRPECRALPIVTISPTLSGWNDAILVIAQSSPGEPTWYKHLRSIAPSLPSNSLNSLRAAVVLRVAEGTFALTFGPAGHFLLAPKSIERGWGRRVALNFLYDAHGKLIDRGRALRRGKRSKVGVGLTSDVISSDSVTLDVLGFDRSQEVLRSVTVRVYAPDLGKYVAGDDSLAVRYKRPIAEAPSLFASLQAAHDRVSYKKHFDFIDNFREVRDSATRNLVWSMVVDHIKNGSGNATHLGIALPIPMDLANGEIRLYGVSGKKKRGGHVIATGDFEGYRAILTNLNAIATLDVDALSKHRLKFCPADSQDPVNVSVQESLEGIVAAPGEARYALLEGSIYQVQRQFLRELDSFVDAVDANATVKLGLPSFSSAPERTTTTKDKKTKKKTVISVRDEHAYCIYIAQGNGRLLLDRKNVITVRGRTSPVEACDVLTLDGEFVHVKRGVSGAEMSHLLAQAMTSAELLVGSRDFRLQLRKKVAELCGKSDPNASKMVELVPLELSDGRNHSVVLAMIDKRFVGEAVPLSKALPFFSKLNLRGTVKRLRERAFSVSIACIPV